MIYLREKLLDDLHDSDFQFLSFQLFQDIENLAQRLNTRFEGKPCRTSVRILLHNILGDQISTELFAPVFLECGPRIPFCSTKIFLGSTL